MWLASAETVGYYERMDRQYRIIIADRSELAANLYRLLLAPLGAALIVRKKFEEARPHFFRHERVDLGIFNSNIFGKGFDEIYERIESAEPLIRIPKIFICRATPSENTMRKTLSKLENSTIVIRPFHPDDFFKTVEGLVERGTR